jgi:hypothetical protein
MRIENLEIKSHNEQVDIKVTIIGVPINKGDSHKINNFKKDLLWFQNKCDSLEINQTVTVSSDSVIATVAISIDNFEKANSLTKELKKKGCIYIDASFKKNKNKYQITLNIDESAFANYSFSWVDRGTVKLTSSNDKVSFFPTESTECLSVNRVSESRITYTMLNCKNNMSSPLRNVKMSYENLDNPKPDIKIERSETQLKEDLFSEKRITYFCVILGGIVSIITIFGYFNRTKS